MSTSNITQWPFVPTDARPIFFNPEPSTQQPLVYTGPWIHADRQTRKRRHSETSSSNDQLPEPVFPKDHTTYAYYLAEQAHLTRKVRVTPSLLVNQNSQRFRISNTGDHIIEWATERLQPAAWCLTLPWNYLRSLRHLKLALNCEEERSCQHLSEKEKTKLSKLRNLDRLLQRAEEFMEVFHRRRQSKYECHESDSDGESDEEMRDTPPRPAPRHNLNPTVEDVEDDEATDFEDDVDVVRQNTRAPSPRTRDQQSPIRNAAFADLDNDEIEVLMDLRQQYNATVNDAHNSNTLQERSPRSEQRFDVAKNEALPPPVQDNGNNDAGRDPSHPKRDDVDDGRNSHYSSSSSDDGSGSEEEGQASPIRISDTHGANSPRADHGAIQPRPEPVRLPAHLIPAQITTSNPVRTRRRKSLSPTLEQGRTYAEYDRFQEAASQHSSMPKPRRSSRIATMNSSVTEPSSTEAPATRTSAIKSPALRSSATGTPMVGTLTESPSLFTPISTSKGAPASFDSPSKHRPTKTSSIWENVISKTTWFPAKESTTEDVQEKTTSGNSLQKIPEHDSSSSVAKSVPSSEIGSGVVPSVQVNPPTPEPADRPGQSTLPQDDVSRPRTTAKPGPVPKKGHWESLLGKKSTAKDSPQSEVKAEVTTTPTSKPGLGNSILGRKKNATKTASAKLNQGTEAQSVPAEKSGLGDNMLERKRDKAAKGPSNANHSTKVPSAPIRRSGLGNNMLERKRRTSDQQMPPPPPPPSVLQSTRRQKGVDNSIPCPNCTFRNAPFALTCCACDTPFTNGEFVARRGRSRVKKTADYDFCDDEYDA